MSRDIILSKKASLERCIAQARAYYDRPSQEVFEKDIIRQDAIAINLQRAMELAIDMANHLIKEKKLGLPKESRESFLLLERAGIIPADLSKKLQGMIGFRNILVHEYQKLDLSVMIDVIENRLSELVDFSALILQAV
jgi:uncharacterized protein YutE (UPF0331/DUF86 family)